MQWNADVVQILLCTRQGILHMDIPPDCLTYDYDLGSMENLIFSFSVKSRSLLSVDVTFHYIWPQSFHAKFLFSF